jgi:LPS O-antigen subunit length determinant protein (WzzB/FepE family)
MKIEMSSLDKNKSDEIDVINLLRVVFLGKVSVLKTVFVFMALGLFIAIFSEDEYTASTTIVPQSSKSAGGNLSGLAALAGVNFSGIGEESDVSPQLYPKILNNISFQKEMLETLITIDGQDSKITYKEYYTNIYRPSVLSYIKDYTIGLPSLLIDLLRSNEVYTDKLGQKKSVIHITKEDKELIELLSSQLMLDINEKDGYIKLTVIMPEAKAAAEFAESAQNLLEQYVIDFKIKKSKLQLDFIKNRYLEKQKEFQNVRQKLALYIDQNQNMNSARAKTQLMYLESEYDLAYAVYSELAKQLETQEIKVKENTPIFTIIEPVFVPIDKTKPKRAIILVVWTFFGLVLSIGFLLLREPFQNILKQINSKS